MVLGIDGVVLATVVLVVFLGGLVKGVTGFGAAIVSTATLATLFDPPFAVVVVILPMLAANLTLVTSLGREGLRSCFVRFWPYVLAALVGTLAGMTLLEVVPQAMLSLGLGLFTLAYVTFTQSAVTVPGEAWLRERCFRSGSFAKAALGFVSGAVFGASNAAVQIVAYLNSQDLDRSTFVGVLAMILVGVSGLRVGAAWVLGLYGGTALLTVSALAIVPGLVGVRAGQHARQYIPEAYQTAGALLLLTVIGIRLTTKGFGL